MVEFSHYFADTSSYLGYETMISYSFAAIVEQYLQKEGLPDWVEAQEYNGIAYYLLQKKHLGYALFRDLKVVVTCHCPSFLTFEHNHINTYQLPYFWIGEMERFCIQAADVCISPSQYLVNTLTEKYSYLQREYHILHNPFIPYERSQTPGDLSDEVVFIGKLSPAKGALRLLKEFAQLWMQGSRTVLTMIGDDNYFYHAMNTTSGAYIRKKYANYIDAGLLRITGPQAPAHIREAVRGAKAVVVPSTVENFPFTVVECMYEGKVVLASAQGGQRELIRDGENGFLFDYQEPGSLLQKLQAIVALDAGTLVRLGEKASQTVREVCDPQHYYQQKCRVLNDAAPMHQELFPFKQATVCAAPRGADQQGLLSVVVPFFNMERYAQETIDSILACAYPQLEIIVVDDGSTEDNSIAWLKGAAAHPKVRVVHQENKGLAEARNTGARAARGEFLAFLDADDKVNWDYYPKAIALLKQKRNVHFVGCWIKYFEGAAGLWPAFQPEPPYILYHNMVNSSSLVYRRQSFLGSGQNDARLIYGMEDYDSVLSMLGGGCSGVVLPEALFYYRVRKDSMARGFNKSNMAYLYQVLTEKHTQFYTTFAADITNLLNANGPGYQCENPTLDYHIYPGNSLKDRIARKLILKVKQQPLLRKVALGVYRQMKSK